MNKVSVGKFRNNSRALSSQSRAKFCIPEPVLVIEDSSTLSLLMKEQLQNRWHCEVHVAASYQQAKDLLKKHRHEYHLVVSDLNLPDAPDGEIVDLIHRAKLKSIVITGSYGDELKGSLSQKGVIDYILKGSINSYSYLVEQVGRLYQNRFKHILLVEDSATSRVMLTHILKVQNFNVHVASNGKEALEILEAEKKIHLVVTDYIMPDMDGIELTVEVRENYKKSQLAIIGISAQDDAKPGINFIKCGANDFLQKPFSSEELICRINQNLELLDQITAFDNLANRDFLTNLHNRRFFFVEGGKIFSDQIESSQSCVVAMLDIDKFKNVNDTYGHDTGDQVLISFASLLNAHFPDVLTARLGGEEFAVLAPGCCQKDICQKLDEFRRTLEHTVIKTDEQSLSVTVSAGVTSTVQGSLDDVLKIADENLYQAKQLGRNRINTGNDNMGASA